MEIIQYSCRVTGNTSILGEIWSSLSLNQMTYTIGHQCQVLPLSKIRRGLTQNMHLCAVNYIVARRPVARQRPRNKHMYGSRYWVTASQTNMFPRQQLNYKNEERCFLCGACRGVISRTSLESDPKITALARTRRICKRLTRPLVRESAPHQQTRNCLTVIKKMIVSPRWVLYSEIDWTTDRRS
jgi:hypothetical protein